MNKAVADDYKEVVDLNNNNDGLGKVQSISNVALEEEERFFDAMEVVSSVEEESDLGFATSEEEEFFDSKAAAFNVPLSIFHYKDYNSDFFTSWYNMSSEILKEINRVCPEKKVLNLALSVLMLPYIAFTALGLVIYNRFKANSKTQADVGEDKTKNSETGVPKRLAYGVLAAIAIFVNVTVLVTLIFPATVALATFYLLNRDLSHSLVTALKISMGQYSNKHQNIEVSFHEKEVPGPSIAWDMEIKFPPQIERLLRDLCEDKNDKLFVTRDSEHNAVLKLSANIHLKNGLVPLRNEIRSILAASVQGFTKTMEELMKLEKKGITYDKLKELLDEFRLKVVDSIDSKLVSHLIENAYQVAFIQAIKFQQDRRGEDFSLEDGLKNTLVRQELESQGRGLPNEKEIIMKDLKKAGEEVPDVLHDSGLPTFKAKWGQLIQGKKIAKRTIIDIYEDIHPQETKKALDNAKGEIEHLKEGGRKRYTRIHEKLEEIHRDEKNSLTDGALKRKLEDLFKFEYDDQEVEQKLIKSRIKAIRALLSKSNDKVKQSLTKEFDELEKKETQTSNEVNDFIKKMYLEITKCRIQSLFEGQARGIKDACKLLEKEAPDLVEKINLHRMRIEKYLKQPEQPILLRKIIEGNKDLNKYLKDEQNSKGKEHPNTKLIELHLKDNKEILKALEQLELEEKELLINEETKNNYREELESREKIKFATIENDLLKVFEHETFDEEAVKKLLEKAELEYYLAEKRIKSSIIKIKDNIKHFCQDLSSPLIDRLVNLIISNIPKVNENGWGPINWYKNACIAVNYNRFWLLAVKNEKSIEGRVLNVAHDTYKEVETFLQHLQSSYEEVGALVGDVFSDDGETFKENIWPKIRDNLYDTWCRFSKDIEFKIGNKLDEVNVTQQNQEIVITA